MVFWKKKKKKNEEDVLDEMNEVVEASEENVEETAEETVEETVEVVENAESEEPEKEAKTDEAEGTAESEAGSEVEYEVKSEAGSDENAVSEESGETEESDDTAESDDVTESEETVDSDDEVKSDDASESGEENSEKKQGFFKRLVSGLTKTRQNFISNIDSVFSGFSSIDDEFYEEIEEILIMGDIGVHTTEKIIDDLKEKVKENKIKKPDECKELLINSIKEVMDIGENAYEFENQKSILLVIGVNGVGKTTSVGKLSAILKGKNKKVIMAAADTFRAAAIEQLQEWSKRAGVDIIAGQEGSDPGAVIFDAIQASKARKADVLICDTAGRLHNKKNLMDELKKIDTIIEKEYSGVYRENLIVLDATTGQNALSQARTFMECTNITGVVLTKMDGSAKGGIAVAIQSELGIPVKYIGVGEKIEDLQKFDANSFVDALFEQSDES